MSVNMPSIVCATDLSDDANNALPLAACIANKYNCKLVIAHIIDLPAVTPYGETMVDPQELRERVEKSAKAQIEDLLKACIPVSWELQIAIGYPAKEIEEIVINSEAILLVAASHMRSGFERVLLGSVSRKLMQTLEIPFLIIPCTLQEDRKNALIDIKSILVACSVETYSDHVVEWGLKFAKLFQAKLTLATVIEPSKLEEIAEADKEKKIGAVLTKQLEGRLRRLVSAEKLGQVPLETAVLVGLPHEELNKYGIMNQADIIVLGVHGRGFLEKLFVGSITDKLLKMGQFPILTVRNLGDLVGEPVKIKELVEVS